MGIDQASLSTYSEPEPKLITGELETMNQKKEARNLKRKR